MITAYQIRNVLRVYGNQLKKRSMLAGEGEKTSQAQRPDTVNISGEARRKEELLNHISNKVLTQVTGGHPHKK